MDERTLRRFWSKVRVGEPDDCWPWIPRLGSGGYGQFYLAGKQVYVHRLSFEIANGSIPSGLVIDHTCDVRHCVNPSHLQAITQRDNIHRARAWESGAQLQREKTHCPQGHPYAGENLHIRVDGSRECRACGREAAAAVRARKRAEDPPKPRELKTHCSQGHAYDADNTYVSPSTGRRTCRVCKRKSVQEYRKRLSESGRRVAPTKLECANGHPFDEANTGYAGGHAYCRECNRQTQRRYQDRRKAKQM